jgi:transient receptor potential cation channel subfamily M member 2
LFLSKSTKYYTWKLKFRTYFSDNWNLLDLLGLVLFFVGYLLRIISFGTNESVFNWSRIVLSIDLTLWYIRSLHFSLLFPSLGPKIVMMQKMIHDLKYFMVILMTFVLGFGISLKAILFPSNEFNLETLLEIFNIAYWPIYGELALLETLNDEACKNGTLDDCASRSSVITGYFILMIYMIIANVLLLNILIAMFSNTYEDIQKDSDIIWKNQRYDLLCEYLSFPLLPPPLNIPCHLVKFIRKQLQANNCIKKTHKKKKLTCNSL